jgi:hypothetical protein
MHAIGQFCPPFSLSVLWAARSRCGLDWLLDPVRLDFYQNPYDVVGAMIFYDKTERGFA